MKPRESRFLSTVVSLCLSISGVVTLCISMAAWLIPVDVIKVRAFNRAPEDSFAQFEAVGRAEALWWLLRVVSVCGTVLLVRAWSRRNATARFAAGLIDDVFSMLLLRRTPDSADWSSMRLKQIVLWIRAVSIAAMLVLACVHQAEGIRKRAGDWAYYQLNSGDDILPNISDSNRAVIRYLRSATPEGSRIFVVSDQKLFFLSYYLLPRHVLHRIHPQAEHLIPRKNQERQLAAYRLSEIPETLLKEQHPDFVLEYFEGAEYVQPERAEEDTVWLNFVRRWVGDSNYLPPYTVVLRPWKERAP